MTGRQWLVCGVLVALALAVPGSAPQREARAGGPPNPIYVDAGATGANNGETWVDALTNLQTAFTMALDGTEIRVAAGTYYPGIDRFSTFQLKNGVTIYGSFPPGGGEMSDRHLGTHPSILSGEIMAPGTADDSFHVVTASGTDATAVLDGFVIRGGCADSSTSPDNRGGGIYNQGGSPTIGWAVVDYNYATQGGGMYNDGGAPSLTGVDFAFNEAHSGGAIMNSDCDLSMSGGWIEHNEAVYGGAMFNWLSDPDLEGVKIRVNDAVYGAGIWNAFSSPTLTYVDFEDNEATHDGGGMHNEGGVPSLTACSFVENSAEKGGAIYNTTSSPTLHIVLFHANEASDAGGGIYNEDSSPVLTALSLTWNSAQYGGGIYSINGTPKIFRSVFTRNTASLFGGGVYCYDSSAALINVHFQGNDADQGGAVSIHGASSSPLIANTVMVGNTARIGAAVETQDDTYVALSNVTVADNEATQQGGGISAAMSSELYVANSILWANLPDQVDSCGACPTTIKHSLVEGGCPPNSICTGKLVIANPQFLRDPHPGPDSAWGTLDDDYGDLGLHPASPAVDAGNNAEVPFDLPDLDYDGSTAEPLPLDIRDAPRFHDVLYMADTGSGGAPLVDMGAYEVWTRLAHLPLITRSP